MTAILRLMSALVKVFGCRPLTKGAARTGGRRPKTSKGGNRDGERWRCGLRLRGSDPETRIRSETMPVSLQSVHNLAGTARVLLMGI
jgi:hypothetical protein